MVSIRVKDVSMHYRRRFGGHEERFLHVLHNLNFDIRDNEFLSIVGPSGCGKTTLLLIVAKLRRPTTGEVRINGRGARESASTTGVSANLGLIFQEYNKVLLPWRTVLENVELGLELKGWSAEKRREVAARYIELAGLTGFERAYPWELSGGMKQRVQLARVLAYNPDVLLMDEPFGSLDAQTKALMQDEFLKVWERERKTVMFVTHDVIEAIYMADRVLVLSARPSTVRESIEVDFPRPRNESLKDASEFIEMKNRIWETIKSEVKM